MGSTLRAISRTEIEAYGYDEFGNNLYPQKSVCQSIGFTGYLSDEEAGTSYAEAREYLPQIGRFVAEDVYGGSIAVPYSQNRYSYCYNNPLVLVDGDGRKPTWKSIQEELDELGDKAKKGVSNVIRGFEENFWRKYVVGEDIIIQNLETPKGEYEVKEHVGGKIFVREQGFKKDGNGWSLNLMTKPILGIGYKKLTVNGEGLDISKLECSLTDNLLASIFHGGNVNASYGLHMDINGIGGISEMGGGYEDLPYELPDGTVIEDYGSVEWSFTKKTRKASWETVTVAVVLAACIMDDLFGGEWNDAAIPVLTSEIVKTTGCMN